MAGILPRLRPRPLLCPALLILPFMLGFLTCSELILISETCKVLNEDETIKSMVLARFKLSLREICLQELEISEEVYISIFGPGDIFPGCISGSIVVSALHHNPWKGSARIKEICIYAHIDAFPLWCSRLNCGGFSKHVGMSEENNLLRRDMLFDQSEGDFTETHSHTNEQTHHL